MAHTRVTVQTIPDCDLCNSAGAKVAAYADARIPQYGSWANVCLDHFKQYSCTLGLGCGQVYVKATN